MKPEVASAALDARDYYRLYRNLRGTLREAGCFERKPFSHVRDAVVVLVLYSSGYLILLNEPEWPTRLLAIVLLAFSCVQAGYIAHEAGHGAITSNCRLSQAIGQFFDTFLSALSYTHFQDIHRRHHPHCNETDKDPDIQGGGFFSLYAGSAFEKRGLGKLVTRFQSVLIWPLVSLQAFTLKRDSLKCIMRKPHKTQHDQIALLAHSVLWFGPPVALLGFTDALVNYLLITWFIGPYLGTIFILNHTGMPTIEPGDKHSFLFQQLSTTRNLGTSRIEGFVFGGLNNHIEHHLFPSIPTANLRRARKITRGFCQRHVLPYKEINWIAGAFEVVVHLREVSIGMVRSSSKPLGHQN